MKYLPTKDAMLSFSIVFRYRDIFTKIVMLYLDFESFTILKSNQIYQNYNETI